MKKPGSPLVAKGFGVVEDSAPRLIASIRRQAEIDAAVREGLRRARLSPRFACMATWPEFGSRPSQLFGRILPVVVSPAVLPHILDAWRDAHR